MLCSDFVLFLESVFGHGQLYVAFSRRRSFQNLFVVLPSKTTPTKHVVHNEVSTMMGMADVSLDPGFLSAHNINAHFLAYGSEDESTWIYSTDNL